MLGFVHFIVTPTGRLARVVVGIALILVGLLAVQGTVGVIIAIVGIVPLATGVLDICILAPLARLPFSGKAIRSSTPK